MAVAGIGSLAVIGLQVVLILIWIGGLVWALVRWRQHPRVSLLMIFALVVLVGLQILDISVPFVMSIYGSQLGNSFNTFTLYYAVWGNIRTFFLIAAWVMVLIAVFSGRSQKSANSAE